MDRTRKEKRKFYTLFTAAAAAFAVCVVLSVACGVKSVGFDAIWDGLLGGGESVGGQIVKARIPRTVFGVVAGAALSVSGMLMQSVTRNPIADPSILGVNTGASLFVVCGIAFLHTTNGNMYMLLAFTGALLAGVFVYGLASIGGQGATPVRLALAGAAASTALQSLVNTVMLPNTSVMERFRFWQTGSIGGATWSDIRLISPYLAVGLITAVFLVPLLNTLALGDEMAVSLGLPVTKVRAVSFLCAILLCAGVTALAGPIGFIGLMIPHMVRSIVGADLKRMMPLCILFGSSLLLGADVIGRFVIRPAELESGIITAIIGGPVFVFIIRKVKVKG